MSDHAGHKIIKCVCGRVLMQCRCAALNKRVETRKPCRCPGAMSDKPSAEGCTCEPMGSDLPGGTPETQQNRDCPLHGQVAGLRAEVKRLKVDRNSVLEEAVQAVKESGYIYGRESALAAISKLKEDQ